MTILYLSSTGNCLYVAKRLGGENLSIPKVLQSEITQIKDDQIGIIFPVYGLCVPPMVEQFLEQIKLKADYIYAVITYGTFYGGVAGNLLQLAKKNDLKLSYIKTLRMVSNYLPAFEMKREINKVSDEELEKKINQIKAEISNQKHELKKDLWISKMLTGIHQNHYAYTIGEGYTKQYKINDHCTGCGMCSLVCPMGNIDIIEHKPHFNEQCMCCLACIQNCPQNAIHMDAEKSAARFRNSHITLTELIKSNQNESLPELIKTIK